MAWRGGGGHAHVPPSNARRPPTTRWRRASEGRSPGQVAPRLAQQAGAHAHAGRGPGRDPGTPPPGGRARAVAGQPTTDKPGPAPRPGARAPERGVGGARRRKGTDDPPRLHTTPPPGRTVAADTERRPQRAWEAPTHQSAPPGLVAERRRPRHGRLAARATRRRRRATGNRTAGQRQGSPTGFQPGALRGRSQVATGVRTGSHRPRPPAQGRSRGTPGRRPGPPPRRTLGQTLAEGPPALPPAAAARPAPGTLSRTRGDPPPAPRPGRTPDARSRRPFLSSSPHSFAHASGADSTPPGTRPPKSHGGPRGGRAPDKRRGLVSGPTR